MPGQSGSPVWVYYSSTDSRYIMTVHTSGNDGSGSNHGTRLNNDKFNRIVTWCGDDTPPTDRADLLDDGDSLSGFSPTAVKPGTTAFHAWSDVRNMGTAASGGFSVSYYASTNTTINTADHLIGQTASPRSIPSTGPTRIGPARSLLACPMGFTGSAGSSTAAARLRVQGRQQHGIRGRLSTVGGWNGPFQPQRLQL